MEIRPLGAEFFCADGQTERYDVVYSHLLKFCKSDCDRTRSQILQKRL